MLRRTVPLLGLLLTLPGVTAGAQDRPYQSPYRVEFTVPAGELIGDLDRTGRGDRHAESSIPHADWYSKRTEERWHAWGPPPRHYPAPEGMEGWSTERKRERAIAVALRYQGYAYQHHHIPDWSPPAGWPWLESCAGANGKGVDCSNLTGFVFNQGFGLRINTDIRRQAESRVAEGPGGRPVPLHRVELPSSYEMRTQALRTGDLLFIRSRAGEVSHVVLWIGAIGKSPDNVPLVLDCHGADTRDSNGALIPCGVHLRPFRKNSWYNGSASHALRVFPD